MGKVKEKKKERGEGRKKKVRGGVVIESSLKTTRSYDHVRQREIGNVGAISLRGMRVEAYYCLINNPRSL